MNLELQSKTAFISGSTQGIGYSIARSLLNEGAEVIINGRNRKRVEIAVNRLKTDVPNGKVSGIAADFNSVIEVSELLDALPEVDILINNVGIFELKPFFELEDMDWTRFLEVNIMSGVRLSKALLPQMLKKNWGRIIFISSESAINVPENMIHYGMTKTAMLSISQGLSKLTKNTGVTVNTIIGGPTYSDGVASAIEHISAAQNQPVEQMKDYIMTAMSPTSLLQRFINPQEIANMALYLSSPLSAATNGSALRVDGGILNTIN